MSEVEAGQRCEWVEDSRLQSSHQQIVREVKGLESRKPSEREVGERGNGIVTQVEAGQPVLESEGEISNLSNMVVRHVEGDQLGVVKELGGAEERERGAGQGELLQTGVQLGRHKLRRRKISVAFQIQIISSFTFMS